MASFHVEFNNPTLAIDPYKEFNKYFGEINKTVNLQGLTQVQTDAIYDCMIKLVRTNYKLLSRLHDSDTNTIKKTENYVCDEIKKYSSSFLRKNVCKGNLNYVEAEEKAIGLQWKSKFEIQNNSVRYTLEQNKFSFVSIISTLKSVFSYQHNLELYLNQTHKCTPGLHKRFCCGSIFQQSQFFKENPKAIQLALSIDEFEPCSALKSKTGIHNITAIYMKILNFPFEYQSRLENIYLVALCCSKDLKQEDTSLNNILELIISEVKILQKKGIELSNGNILKGTLSGFCFDNAGMNKFFSCFNQKKSDN